MKTRNELLSELRAACERINASGRVTREDRAEVRRIEKELRSL